MRTAMRADDVRAVRVLAVLLGVIVALFLLGCGDNSDEDQPQTLVSTMTEPSSSPA